VCQDAFHRGIEDWHTGIETIQFKVAIDDFGTIRNTTGGYQVHEDGQVTMTEGWIPTEDSMMAFMRSVLEDRPELRRFNLAILAGSDVHQTSDEKWKQVFEFDYVTHGNDTLNRRLSDKHAARSYEIGKMGNIARTFVEDEVRPEPEVKTVIGHTAIRALHDDMLKQNQPAITADEIRAALSSRMSLRFPGVEQRL
jgi:hypothetical protein